MYFIFLIVYCIMITVKKQQISILVRSKIKTKHKQHVKNWIFFNFSVLSVEWWLLNVTKSNNRTKWFILTRDDNFRDDMLQCEGVWIHFSCIPVIYSSFLFMFITLNTVWLTKVLYKKYLVLLVICEWVHCIIK